MPLIHEEDDMKEIKAIIRPFKLLDVVDVVNVEKVVKIRTNERGRAAI